MEQGDDNLGDYGNIIAFPEMAYRMGRNATSGDNLRSSKEHPLGWVGKDHSRSGVEYDKTYKGRGESPTPIAGGCCPHSVC